MPGQRKVYEDAMREAADAAWDHEWDRAVQAYGIALGEFPEDTDALAGLGLALVEAGRLDEAMEVYRRAIQLSPDDPLPLEKLADVLERMGRLEDAGKQYVAVAEIFLSRRNVDRAIANWERAVGLLPADVRLRSRLAVAYERTRHTSQAVREYVALAGIFQRQQDLPKATQALQRALRIDPANEQVRNTLASLRSGSPVELPAAPDLAQGRKGGFEPFEATKTAAEVRVLNPTAEAVETALSTLAELMFEEGLPEGAMASTVKAIEQQRAGGNVDAVASYERAMKSGLKHPAAWFNRGILYHQVGDIKKAIGALRHVADDPVYGLAANLALGQSYQAAEESEQAARHLVQALRYADLALETGRDEAELNASYDELLQELEEQDAEKLRVLTGSLLEMLNAEDWRRRLAEKRSHLESGQAIGLIQMLLEPGAERVTGVLEHIDEYISRGMFQLAMGEAHYAVELSPWYLPAHLRMAEILTKTRRQAAAAEKYNVIANTLLVRGEKEKAADIFAEVLHIAPMDLPARRRLIDMLVEQGRVPEALQHFEGLAQVYETMADTEKARKVYQEAIMQAQQFGVEAEQIVRLLHYIGDLDMQRLDWRQALRNYEQIKALMPGDEKANLAIVDLYYRLNDAGQAISQLDAYLTHCIENKKLDRVVAVLEEQVRSRPDEIPLRQRLAKVYEEQKRLPEAIAQMDALGELLLEAGRQSEAIETIRRIVTLNPPDVDGYRQLLRQMEGSAASQAE